MVISLKRTKTYFLTRLLKWNKPWYWWKALLTVADFPVDLKIQYLEKILESGKGWFYFEALGIYYEVLGKFSEHDEVPGELKRKYLEKILEPEALLQALVFMKSTVTDYRSLSHELLPYALLRNFPNLPERLKFLLRERTWSLWRGTKETLQIIESFFGNNYMIVPRFNIYFLFDRVNNDQTPVFPNIIWKIFDTAGKETLTEALIGPYWGHYHSQVRILLLRDAQSSYAYQVPPQANSVREAIAWFYGLDPVKFQGFTKEI
ncbi:MAG: hypothetical protein QME57_04740 [Patescibacteria group bacterium]|nr:hypothetical protein [Patescibacteria group bacterium]